MIKISFYKKYLYDIENNLTMIKITLIKEHIITS